MMERHWRRNALDVINFVAAAFLFLSPWIFGFASVAEASRNAWICGVAIGIPSLAAVFAYAEWEGWASLALGLWLIVSSWILGFHHTVMSAMKVDVVVGITVAVFSAGALWFMRHTPPRVTA